MNETAPVRLLLVDDEAALREPLADYLSRQGFDVSQAPSAAEARSLIRDETPDLVLLDIMMPGEDGLSLCRHLVETHRQIAHFDQWAHESCNQQAARVLPTSISSGRSLRQRAKARGQRGLKAQPGGMAFRRGMAPSICCSRSRSESIAGMEPIRPTV